MEILVAILVFLGVVLVSVLFFGGWVLVAIVRLLARALGGTPAVAPPPPLRMPPPQRVPCGHANCRAANAPAARFCRRCGRPFAARPAPVVRRVAMW